ncbi:(+)-piperitol/(+)-sesamin synthase CYP81Q2-like [Bidens hawaiensis]|uniref:(+)-piperitol/(+)-sesamin synthase CYP81Q2-like n=1 Tax=Bidens hawaiensis TaxID=980011 RepID=UPI00404B408A
MAEDETVDEFAGKITGMVSKATGLSHVFEQDVLGRSYWMRFQTNTSTCLVAEVRVGRVHRDVEEAGKPEVNTERMRIKMVVKTEMVNIVGQGNVKFEDESCIDIQGKGSVLIEGKTVEQPPTNYRTLAKHGPLLPVLSWLGVKGLEKKLIKLQDKRDVFFQGLIEQLRKTKGDESVNKRKTMIELLLSLQESEPEYYTDAMIRSFVLVLLAAGTDTSAGTMEWAMTLLLNHPHVLKKAQHEIDTVIGNNRLVDESDIPNLSYIRCIINETLRICPAGPLLVPHEASSDCVVGSYNVPRGTMLLVNQWAIHHDPKVWEDPETFKPERFEGLDGTRDGFKLLPFGSGRRSCPGEGLAVHMLGMTLGAIIQCFDWERMSEEKVDMTEGPGLTMPKAVPLVAKCKPRVEIEETLSDPVQIIDNLGVK